MQGVFAKFQCSAVCCYQFLFYACLGKIFREKLLHKLKAHSRRNHRYFRVFLQKYRNTGGMVGLHMLDNQIIRCFSFQYCFQILQPFFAERAVNRIHNRCFFIHNYIGIVRHAVRHPVLSFKQIHLMVIHSYIFYTCTDFHRFSS